MNFIQTIIIVAIFLESAGASITIQASESKAVLPTLPKAITSFGAIRAGRVLPGDSDEGRRVHGRLRQVRIDEYRTG